MNEHLYSIEHAAKALVNYVYKVDVVESRIGEYGKSDIRAYKSQFDMIVSGHVMYDIGKNPSYLYTPINSTSLNISKKIKDPMNKKCEKIIRDYLSSDEEKANIVVEKLSKINNSKYLIVPIKPHTEIELTDSKKYTYEVNRIEWRTNNEKHILECTLKLNPKEKIGGLIDVKLNDYLTEYKISGIKYGDNTKCISMNCNGIIKPVEYQDGIVRLVIDGMYVYAQKYTMINVIGKWDLYRGKVDFNKDAVALVSRTCNTELTKTRAYETLVRDIDLLKKHRTYIAPFGTCDTNKIDL